MPTTRPSIRARIHAPVPWPVAALATLFVGTGILHLVIPETYARIVPRWLPHPTSLVVVSGGALIAGGVGLAAPRTRRAAAAGLVVLLVAMTPANVEMLRQARAARYSAAWQAALWLRLPLQAALIWGVHVAGRPRPRTRRAA